MVQRRSDVYVKIFKISLPLENGDRLVGFFLSYGQTPWPIIMTLAFNVLGTKVEWRICKEFLLTFRFKLVAVLWFFLQLRVDTH